MASVLPVRPIGSSRGLVLGISPSTIGVLCVTARDSYQLGKLRGLYILE